MSTLRIFAALRPVAMALAAIAMLIALPAAAMAAKPPSAAAIARQVTAVPIARALRRCRQRDAVQADPGAVPACEQEALLLYVGANFCSYCAAERWAIVSALSRFGTFSNLGLTSSTTDDTFPATPSFSFHGSSYTSRFITLQAVELSGNARDVTGSYPRLDSVTKTQQNIAASLDRPALRAGARLDPVHRDRGPLRALQFAVPAGGPRGPEPGAGRQGARESVLAARAGHPRRRQLADRIAVRGHRRQARVGLHADRDQEAAQHVLLEPLSQKGRRTHNVGCDRRRTP